MLSITGVVKAVKSNVQVAVIGGGVTGCSVAYHLAKAGWSDVVLIERSELTAGSSWHAAGGTGAFADGANMAMLHRYSFELYPELEAETGQSCGFHHAGGLMLARTTARREELKRHRTLAHRHGLVSEWLSEAEALYQAPILDMRAVKAVLWDPARGHVDPSGVTHAFAKGARQHGAEIYRHCPVVETNLRADGTWDVATPNGTIHAERIVNAAGLWAREVAALADIYLPLMPVEHHYFVTESIPEIEALDHELPLIGDADAEFYMRQEGKGLLLGVYEEPCTHWAVNGTPQDFGHELLPDDFDRIERNFAQAIDSIPVLGRAGIKRVINGPMIFSPDLNPLIGPYPGLPSYWCACGVMTAFSQAASIGMVLTEWMSEGEPGFDVFMWDVTRYGDWADKEYTRARTADMYSTRFKTMYPYEERPAGRPVRTTPAYSLYQAERAVFGSGDGWEYPLWYAPEGSEPKDSLTFRRPNWFDAVAAECRALHEGVGIIDISTYGKHSVIGANAHAWLERIMANRMPTEDGRIVLTPMLSHKGRIIGDFTVSRLSSEEYFLVGSGIVDRYHHRWWEQWLPADGVGVESATARLCGFSVSGPRSRELLARLTDEDLSNKAWPYLRARRLELGPARNVIVMRMAYTGELGYEVFCLPEQQVPLLEALREAGADLGARLVGMRALGSLRIEKGFGSWGREFALDYTPFEAGLGRFVKLDKTEFVGREAALVHQQQPLRFEFCCFEIDTDEADPWGGEPLRRDGEVVGYLTSASYGHRVGRSLALGYLEAGAIAEPGSLVVDVLGDPRAVTRLDAAAFDPAGKKMRA